MAPPAKYVHQPGANRLLALLPRDEYARIVADLEEIQLTRKQVLARPDEAYTHARGDHAGQWCGWRLPVRRFQEHLRECPGLRAVAQRYALSFMNQTARSSACNRMHEIHQRLARWLLLVHDRVNGDEFGLTQEYLSEMLGVRRPSVSLAARTLQNAGLITYRWGRISVLARHGLEDAACDDYRQTVTEYENLFDSKNWTV